MSLLDWWRDWRERRGALKEMRRLRDRDEAELLHQNQNPLHLAKLCASSGDLEGAAAHWEEARARLPNAVVTSRDSLDILLALKRYDEAEALLRERGRRAPGDRSWLNGLALIAELRDDTEEALKRWRVVSKRVMDSNEGFHGSVRCLMKLGRLDEAEAELRHAQRRDAMDYAVRVGFARVSDRRQDWARSVTLWQRMAEENDDGPAFACAARAMAELGHLEEADTYLAAPARRFANNLEIALTNADLARRRGDLPALCDRWARVRLISPYFAQGYLDGVDCLVEAGRHDEAEAAVRAAIERFPDEAWPTRKLAHLAHGRGDWDEAARRWASLRDRFPEDEAGYSFGADALRAAGRAAEAAALRVSE